MKTARKSKGQAVSAKAGATRSGTSEAGRSATLPLDVGGERGVYTSMGYRTVRVARRDGVVGVGASSEQHMRYDRRELVNQSRMFMRDNGIYKGMIGRAVSFIVGSGFSLQAKTGSKKWNAQAEALWKAYWRRPEIKQVLSGLQVERMICREILVAGDTGVIKTKTGGGLLQLIEAEQIVGKKRVSGDGIEKDQWGRPTGFSVAPYGGTGRLKKDKSRSYTPANFLFVTDPDRPSAVRTAPPC